MDPKVLLIFLGMALVTFIPRFLPLALLSRRRVPEYIINWLDYVPVAIISALLAPGILMENSRIFLSLDNSFLLASIPTFLCALITRNMFFTVITGMISVVGIRYFLV